MEEIQRGFIEDCQELSKYVKPYQTRTEKDVELILWLFYIPVFLCIPCFFLGLSLFKEVSPEWLRWTLLIAFAGFVFPYSVGQIMCWCLVFRKDEKKL
jgi:hypothetical protein